MKGLVNSDLYRICNLKCTKSSVRRVEWRAGTTICSRINDGNKDILTHDLNEIHSDFNMRSVIASVQQLLNISSVVQ